MKYELVWNEDEFKRGLIDFLIPNAEIAGDFIERDARKRLLSIKDPEWGRAYRREVVSRLLDNGVEESKDEVTIFVGVRKSKSGKHHGFYIEIGSSTAPAHPFLRPAVFGNAQKILDLIAGK